MLAGIEEMEAELTKEFGELAFRFIVKDVPSVERSYLTGYLVLPDGTPSEATVTFLGKHTEQEASDYYRAAITTITIAVLRRLARFYQKEKA